MRSTHVKNSDGKLSRRGDLIGAYGFAYVLAILLIAIPIYNANVWSILGNTRLMVPLINAGVIAYHDLDLGFVKRVGELKEYYKAQQPVDWWLVGVVCLIYVLFYMVKAYQFHAISRFLGMKGQLGQHARAFYYGLGINRLLPYNTGDVATVKALEDQGESRQRATTAVFTQDVFVCFEIAVFFIIGLFLSGWEMSFIQTVMAVLFWAVLYFVMRPALKLTNSGEGISHWKRAISILRAMADQPFLLVKLGLLSIFAFFLDDITPYITSQAFTSGPVILNVPFLVIQGGVVAGYLASRTPITPGGIGQYEFGFGSALFMAGIGFDVAVAIALLDGLFRHTVALLMFALVRFGFGVETDVRSVLTQFIRPISENNLQIDLAGERA